MRLPFLAALLTACAADLVPLPDAGPCSSACGAGTVCSGGACVAVDAGELSDAACPYPDAQTPCMCGSVVGFRVCQVDRTYTTCLCSFPPPDGGIDAGIDAGAPMDVQRVDAGSDAGATDTDPRQSEVCRGVTTTCDGRTVNVQGGEIDGGRTYHCGACGVTCAVGEFCINCVCTR